MNSGPGVDVGSSVLIFAPVGRDAELARDVLTSASIASVVCASIGAMVDLIAGEGAGALLMTEEALGETDFPRLTETLQQQAPWSDIPVLLFAGRPGAQMDVRVIRSIDALRNVTLLERPIRLAAALTTTRAALRSRARQYEVRDLLVALHRARAEAETANRMKDEFLATLSHELRTPLNAILGWTSMLVRDEVDPARLRRVFEALDRNAHSQAQLIADVLDVSRIVTGKLQLQRATVDVCDSVARAADAVRPAALAKNITLRIEDSSDCIIRGDPDRLQQVFWNLLSNAVKFTPIGGSIDVAIARSSGSIAIAVIDSGVGIPQEFLPFVFDRFRQADQTTTRAHSGLGLGLSIVKHLIELHGGTVEASSRGAGAGARFEVRLPTIDSPADLPAPAPSRSEAVRLDGCLILVVDDDESSREVVTAALEGANARVQVAASADEARQRLQEHVPQMIISDLAMPGEDGLLLMRDVRGGAAREVPAIALSAYADAASRDAARDAGFDAFLAKPARVEALLALVRSLLPVSVNEDR
jgi:signal transduction histidine kinase/ActR/RegA family two-component response regulator